MVKIIVKREKLVDLTLYELNSEAFEAPWIKKYVNPLTREILVLVMTSLSFRTYVHTYVHTQNHRKTNTKGTLKCVKLCCRPRLFGGKLHGQVRFGKTKIILKTAKYKSIYVFIIVTNSGRKSKTTSGGRNTETSL